MDNKKHPERFTIAFNLDDERQREASEELRRHGRRKARFVTDAILCYTQGQPSQAGAGAPVNDIVKQCVAEVLQNLRGRTPSQTAEADMPPIRENPAPADAGQQWNNEDLSVIAGTLSAFRK